MLKYNHGCRAGSGASLEVDIAEAHNDCNVIFRLARQTNNADTASADGERWQFNDPRPALIKLNAQQVARIIAVLSGEANNIAPHRKGMAVPHRKGMAVNTQDANGILFLEREFQPYEGFNLHIKQEWADGEKSDARILLNINESVCLRLALEAIIGKIAFGK